MRPGYSITACLALTQKKKKTKNNQQIKIKSLLALEALKTNTTS